jgi:hypothetical protein
MNFDFTIEILILLNIINELNFKIKKNKWQKYGVMKHVTDETDKKK